MEAPDTGTTHPLHQPPILNTVAIKLDDQWYLTTIADLLRNEFPHKEIIWSHEGNQSRTVLEPVVGSRNASSALDKFGGNKISLFQAFRDIATFIDEWAEYYIYLSPEQVQKATQFWFITFDDEGGLPWERGTSLNSEKLQLISGQPLDLPLGVKISSGYRDNIGFRDGQRGRRYYFFLLLCWVEVISARTVAYTLSSNHGEDDASTRGETSGGTRTTENMASVTVQHILRTIRSDPEYLTAVTEMNSNLNDIVIAEFKDRRPQLLATSTNLWTQEVWKWANEKGFCFEDDTSSPENVFVREIDAGVFQRRATVIQSVYLKLLASGIVFQADDGRMKFAAFVRPRKAEVNYSQDAVSSLRDRRQTTWLQDESRPFGVMVNVTFVTKKKLLTHLLTSAGEDHRRAVQRLKLIKTVSDGAKGRISRVYQALAWVYVVAMLLLAAVSVIFNFSKSDGFWERLFSGIEFLTFALIGVFGLLKLTQEDPNAIRNTFLGYVRMRSEGDVRRYLKTTNVPLAIALLEASEKKRGTAWAHPDYASYSNSPCNGTIRLFSGLDKENAHRAGIYPIGKRVAADLRKGQLRLVSEKGNGIIHLDEQLCVTAKSESDVELFPRITTEVFH